MSYIPKHPKQVNEMRKIIDYERNELPLISQGFCGDINAQAILVNGAASAILPGEVALNCILIESETRKKIQRLGCLKAWAQLPGVISLTSRTFILSPKLFQEGIVYSIMLDWDVNADTKAIHIFDATLIRMSS